MEDPASARIRSSPVRRARPPACPLAPSEGVEGALAEPCVFQTRYTDEKCVGIHSICTNTKPLSAQHGNGMLTYKE